MSGYDFDRRIVFATLAIGDKYFEQALTLVQSVMKFTSSDIYVITDKAAECDGHVRYFGDRLKIIDITKYDNYTSHIGEKFNYHLKAIAIEMVARSTGTPIVYVDADTFVFGWDKSISRYINSFENSLMCRFREKVSDNTSMARFIPEKAKGHNVDYTQIHTHLAMETVMVFTRGQETDRFLAEWKRISDYSIQQGLDPFIEAFELALALHNTNYNCINVTAKTPFADNFRTLHNGKLISTNII